MGATQNTEELVPVPFGVVTDISPVIAPIGTVAVMLVDDTTVNVVAAVPLKATDVAPVKEFPVRVTTAPTCPWLGVKLVTVGETRNEDALVTVPATVVTLIGPEVAPDGTGTTILPLVSLVGVAAAPLNLTEVAFARLAPVIVTDFPVGPVWGLKFVIVGGRITVKLVLLVAVPVLVVTLILPVVAPAGTGATIVVAVSLVGVVVMPLNVTEVALTRLVPVIVTEVPTGPDAGAKLVIVGVWPWAGAHVKHNATNKRRTNQNERGCFAELTGSSAGREANMNI